MPAQRWTDRLLSCDIPQDDSVVPTARSKDLPIRAEGDTGHIICMPNQRLPKGLTRFYIPQDDRVIRATRGEQFPIWAKGKAKRCPRCEKLADRFLTFSACIERGRKF